MNLRFAPKAERQVTAIVGYIANDNPAAAQRVLRDIRDAATLLTDFPEAGRLGSAQGTREWVVQGRPYIIVYRLSRAAEELEVIEVVHAARGR